MSFNNPELEVDQEITTFSLSVLKNVFAQTGFDQGPLETLIPVKEELNSPIFDIDSNLVSPISFPQRPTFGRPSNFSAFDFGDYNGDLVNRVVGASISPHKSDSPVISPTRISVRPKYSEYAIEIISHENDLDPVGAYLPEEEEEHDDNSSYYIPSVTLVAREEFSNRLFKEGWLEKKASTNVLAGWQKRYFQAKPFELCYSNSLESAKAREGLRTINLLVHPCEVTSIKDCVFSIKIEGIEKKLRVRAPTLREAIEWVDFLKDLFKYAKDHCQSNKYYSQKRKKLAKLDTTTEEDFVKEASTGDLLLFKKNSKSTNKCLSNNTNFDHVSLVVRVSNELYLYDSIPEKGVHIYSWQEFKKTKEFANNTTIVHRKLNLQDPQIKETLEIRIYRFITKHCEANDDHNLNKILEKLVLTPESPEEIQIYRNSFNSTIALSPVKEGHKSRLSPFPSPEGRGEEDHQSAHLIANIYKSIGLLGANKSISKYKPRSFSKKLQLLKGGNLSDGRELVLLN